MSLQRHAQLLALAGTLPFFAGLLLLVSGNSFAGYGGALVSHTYGVAIVSFLAGIHWGTYLFAQGNLNLFIASNAISIAAWFSLLFAGSKIGFGLLILCFCAALWVDWKSHRENLLPAWFWRLRLEVSLIVLVLLGLTLVAA